MLDPIDVFNTFKPHRGNAIVTAQGTAGRHWGDISDQPSRDISLGGAMGHTTSAAFGLALGLPDEKVVLFDAEGSLLMNLGVLASIAGKKPANFVHFVLDNECYATTGGQPVPNSAEIDYAAMAKGRGVLVRVQLRRPRRLRNEYRGHYAGRWADTHRDKGSAGDREPADWVARA